MRPEGSDVIMKLRTKRPKRTAPHTKGELDSVHMATLTVDNVESIVRNLLLSLDVSVSDQVFENLINFMFDENNIVLHLNSSKQLQEHYDACKTRYECLYKKVEEILDYLQIEDVESIHVTRHGDKHVFNFGNDTTINFQTYIEDFVINLIDQVHPRSYKYLYKALGQFLMDISGETRVGAYEHTRQFCLVILSLGKIYDDIRGDFQFINEQETAAIERLSHEDIELSDELIELLDSVIDDIYDNPNLPYIRDIARGIKTGKYLESSYDEDQDIHISLRSTGTKVNGHGQKGLLASIVEFDPLVDKCKEFDTLVNFHSHYLTKDEIESIPGLKVKQYSRKTISIEQHKLKRRIIHMCANPIQDRAQWYHNRIARFIRQLPSDCTFDQDRGIQRALVVTSAREVNSHQWNVYCLDLSNATDTLSRQYQQICIDILMPNLGQYWSDIVFDDHVFCKHDRSEVILSQKRGQPQGYKSSFPAFAWAHHILMRMLMKLHHLEYMRPEEFYRVLGDDSLISVKDDDRTIMYDYIHLCSLVGWECHDDKGYKFFFDSDEHASAEFAKVRVMDGRVFTPVPLMLMLNGYKPVSAMACCLHNIKRQQLSSDITRFINRLSDLGYSVDPETEKVINLLAYYKLGDFKYLTGDIHEPSSEEGLVFMQAYFLSKLKGTILEQWAPSDYIGDASKKENISDPFMGYEYEEKLLSIVSISDDHKYWHLIYKNEALINALDSIFGKSTTNKGVVGLNLGAQELDKIYAACELIMDDINTMSQGAEYFLNTLQEAISILENYNPRSDSRCSQRDSDYVNSIAEKYQRLEFNRLFAE